MRKWILVFLIFLVGCGVVPPPDYPEEEHTIFLPLVKGSKFQALENGDFEAGFWKQVRWWQWGDPNPRSEQFDNVRVPEGWTGWWVNQRPCPG